MNTAKEGAFMSLGMHNSNKGSKWFLIFGSMRFVISFQ